MLQQLPEWPHNSVVGTLRPALRTPLLGNEAFSGKFSSFYNFLKHVVPVSQSRSSVFRINLSRSFAIPHSIPAICLRERSTRVAAEGVAAARGHARHSLAAIPTAQKGKWTDARRHARLSHVQRLVITSPCFMPASACSRFCETVVSTCRSLDSRCTCTSTWLPTVRAKLRCAVTLLRVDLHGRLYMYASGLQHCASCTFDK